MKFLICAAFVILSAAFSITAQTVEYARAEKMRIYAVRLKPNQDLRLALERFIKDNKIGAGFIVTAVGSLKAAKIRFAAKTVNDFFEIRDNKSRFRIGQYVLTGF